VLVVATANVNGIRAATRKGFGGWLRRRSRLDVVALQEVRATDDELADCVGGGWFISHAVGFPRGRNGVAVLSRQAPSGVRVGFGSAEFDGHGRYVEVDLDGVTVASVYVPKGQQGSPQQAVKRSFLDQLLPYLAGLRLRMTAEGREVIVCGDWNIAHTELDLKNWKANLDHAGFLPWERRWLDRLYGEAGYVDVVRAVHVGVPGPYSWWSYRGRAFDNDAGWRIDHQAVTPVLAARAVAADVDRAPSWDSRPSDHAPVVVTYA